MSYLSILTIIVLITFLSLSIWRLTDEIRTNSLWKKLKKINLQTGEVFDPEMVKNLPEPVQRFFLYSIKSGTVLQTTVELKMLGEISLGTKIHPGYLPMSADQILSPSCGFIWKVSAGSGFNRLSGSDASHAHGSWSRFWLMGILPVARAGNNKDHFRSSFGRYISEAVFLLPGSMLPSENITWQEITNNIVRVTIKRGELNQSIDLTLNEMGQPTEILFERWSNANSDKEFRTQPFGGYLSEYKLFDGYMLPTKIEAGNLFGTEDYFPFYKATIIKACFPPSKNF